MYVRTRRNCPGVRKSRVVCSFASRTHFLHEATPWRSHLRLSPSLSRIEPSSSSAVRRMVPLISVPSGDSTLRTPSPSKPPGDRTLPPRVSRFCSRGRRSPSTSRVRTPQTSCAAFPARCQTPQNATRRSRRSRRPLALTQHIPLAHPFALAVRNWLVLFNCDSCISYFPQTPLTESTTRHHTHRNHTQPTASEHRHLVRVHSRYTEAVVFDHGACNTHCDSCLVRLCRSNKPHPIWERHTKHQSRFFFPVWMVSPFDSLTHTNTQRTPTLPVPMKPLLCGSSWPTTSHNFLIYIPNSHPTHPMHHVHISQGL